MRYYAAEWTRTTRSRLPYLASSSTEKYENWQPFVYVRVPFGIQVSDEIAVIAAQRIWENLKTRRSEQFHIFNRIEFENDMLHWAIRSLQIECRLVHVGLFEFPFHVKNINYPIDLA